MNTKKTGLVKNKRQPKYLSKQERAEILFLLKTIKQRFMTSPMVDISRAVHQAKEAILCTAEARMASEGAPIGTIIFQVSKIARQFACHELYVKKWMHNQLGWEYLSYGRWLRDNHPPAAAVLDAMPDKERAILLNGLRIQWVERMMESLQREQGNAKSRPTSKQPKENSNG